MYSLEELWKRWQQGTLTVEQAIGQTLRVQHLLAQEKRNKPPKPKPKKRSPEKRGLGQQITRYETPVS